MPLVGEIPLPPPKRAPSTRAASLKPSSSKSADEQPSKTASRTSTLMEWAGIFQGVAIMTGNYADAETIETDAGPFLTAVAKLGDVHPTFGESLDKIQGMGPYVAVFAAAVPLTLQFLANHNRIDATRIRFGGIQDPAILHNRQAAKIAQAQAELIREQRKAAEDAHAAQQALQAEMEAFQAMSNQMASV